jgi:hypothetical protein
LEAGVTKKSQPSLPEQFFYDVHFLKGGHTQVTADRHTCHGLSTLSAEQDAWLIFYNRDDEVFRYRVSGLAGWNRLAKPGVTA